MRTGVALALLLAVASTAAAAGGPTVPVDRAPLYASTSLDGSQWTFSRVDPRTLKPLGSPTATGAFGLGFFSPDERRVALERQGDHPAIRVLDLVTGRLGPVLRTSTVYVGDGAWLAPRLLVLAETDKLVLIDPAVPRVLRRIALPGWVEAAGRDGGSLVLLIGPRGSIGTATVAVLAQDGSLRTVGLDRIPAGSYLRPVAGGDPTVVVTQPALAVDPTDHVAYVVGAGTAVAAVRLSDLSVTYHGGPAAMRRLAKTYEGTTRFATWLGDGRFAVVGEDMQGTTSERVPLQLVDPRGWTIRTLSAKPYMVEAVGSLLITAGPDGIYGLRADGSVVWRLPVASLYASFAAVHAPYAYVPSTLGRMAVVDARTGSIVAEGPGTIDLSSP